MSSTVTAVPPPDAEERARALDAGRSVLVEAPAGSGKTDLLTRRFLRLLAEVDEPGQIVAITFTNAAAAEMRRRILEGLEKAAREGLSEGTDALSMEALAARALARSHEQHWDLIDLPGQLRILTIDAFCRELAVQQPLITELGGGLDIFDDPNTLYRRAARATLEEIDTARPELRSAIETLLRWRDNGWQDLEDLLMEMLAKRDRWMQDFVFAPSLDWDALRARLERPFARAARNKLDALSALLDQVPRARERAMELTRFACANTGGARHGDLAELAEFPIAPFADAEALADAGRACACLAGLLLTNDGAFRKSIDIKLGFPSDRKQEKGRLLALIGEMRKISGLESSLAAARTLPQSRYSEDEWEIMRACIVLLRQAAAHLKVEFAQAGAADYIEVAQIAMQALRGDEEIPGDRTLAAMDDIRHLLVDEFQDTSRRQHQMLGRLIAAWPERAGRTCFVVGDPMQSIYSFRDADAELFAQVRDRGLNIPGDRPLAFDHSPLRTNFRTVPSLIEDVNRFFAAVFDEDDGSGVGFTKAEPPGSRRAGPVLVEDGARLHAHFEFVPSLMTGGASANGHEKDRVKEAQVAARDTQIAQIVDLIRSHTERMEAARAEGRKYRMAVLGRAHTALTPIAAALRTEGIPFRAIELEKLRERPEVMDALAIARALLNPHDRLAWLGLLRAPWCGLALADLHTLTSADDKELQRRAVRELMAQRAGMLTEQGRVAVARVLHAMEAAEAWRTARPGTALGTWVEQAWLRLGGADCVDEVARANVDLLWRCLDKLPEGDADVPGPALENALDQLKALPDPRADGDCGVQLMTIHKAKGLEFEVVIVPELQAGGGQDKKTLLSWLERGLPAPDDELEVTEFLVAPIQPKGEDRGNAKAWVDGEHQRREKQEARRILYVAATRAREELHFFARPVYKSVAGGVPSLAEPKESLLKTAWPALEQMAQEQFNAWLANWTAEEGELSEVAAGEGKVVEMPAAAKPARLRRLPANYQAEVSEGEKLLPEAISGLSAEPFYRRHEGGLLSRALGIAVHTVFEELARLRATRDWETTRSNVGAMQPRLEAQVRGLGTDPAQAARTAAKALQIAVEALDDPLARWVLSPHAEAESEARWAGVTGGGVHAVRVDRVFCAGSEPGSEGSEAWWIVDYKTAHAEDADPGRALPELRALFAPQLDAYARVLRGLRGADAVIRAGIYYPRMKMFDWWEIESSGR